MMQMLSISPSFSLFIVRKFHVNLLHEVLNDKDKLLLERFLSYTLGRYSRLLDYLPFKMADNDLIKYLLYPQKTKIGRTQAYN